MAPFPIDGSWIEATGTLRVTTGDIRIYVGVDFCKYYIWLFRKASFNTIKVGSPAHDGHITIINERLHPGIDTTPILHLHDMQVTFHYYPDGVYGGRSRGFLNFYLPVHCQLINDIKQLVGVVEDSYQHPDYPDWDGTHITVFNNKTFINESNHKN